MTEEDFTFEENTEDMGDLGAAQAKIKRLRTELKEAQQKRDEYLDGWQRCKADMVNARQEFLRQGERAGQRAFDALVEDTIMALDGFDMAAASEAWNAVEPQWRSGVEGIQNQLLDALKRSSVERFGKTGDAIDHRMHEVVQEVDDAPVESDTIARVLRFGYRKEDRIIRPAQVIAKK